MKIEKWLVRADEPFCGYALSFLQPDGTVAYTDGLTPEQYATSRGYSVRIITSAEHDALIEQHEASLITGPKEETEEAWYWALECLPPSRWSVINGVELFHVSERIRGDLVSWHARIGDQFWTLTDQATRAPEELAAIVAAAAKVNA